MRVAKVAMRQREREDAEQKTPYPKGSLGHDVISGQAKMWKRELHQALDKLCAGPFACWLETGKESDDAQD